MTLVVAVSVLVLSMSGASTAQGTPGEAGLFAAGNEDFTYAAAWGANEFGELGDGTNTASSVPVDVSTSGPLRGQSVVQVASGYSHSCAVTTLGEVYCWGDNSGGQLGDGTSVNSAVPVAVDTSGVLQGQTVTSIAAGVFHTCVLTSADEAFCWGQGYLGDGEFSVSPVPVAVDTSGVLAGKTLVQLAAGGYHSCVVASEGDAYCWGWNGFGQLGNGSQVSSPLPVAVDTSGELAGRAVTKVFAGVIHSCALTSDARLWCWGGNENGQLGDDTFTDSTRPVAVVMAGVLAGKTVTQVSAGAFQSCVVTSDGRVACWGFNSTGLGDGLTRESGVPVAVDNTGVLAGTSVVGLSVGQSATSQSHTCVVTAEGGAACWGTNRDGQLGDGTTSGSPAPVAVVPVIGALGAARSVVATAAGGDHTVAIYTHDSFPSEFEAMAPVRVLDTRVDVQTAASLPTTTVGIAEAGTALGFPIVAGATVVVDLTGVVPPGTSAVSYNVTATGQTASGYAEVAPEKAVAGSSTINWSGPLQTIANGHITKVGVGNKIQVTVGGTGSAHIILDVTGAFAKVGERPTLAALSTAERRIYDSRDADGPLAAGASRTLNINNDVRATAEAPAPTAAAVNVTGTKGSGVLSVAKEATTTTSAINWSGANQTLANAVITDLAADGSLTVTNNGGTPAELVVDLTAVFIPGGGGAMFYATEPARTYDSRLADSPLTDTRSRLTTQPLPMDAVAVALNTTITGTTGTGYLSVTAPDTDLPLTSTLNWFESPTTRANGTITPVSQAQTRAFVGGPHTTHYLHDINGYFE